MAQYKKKKKTSGKKDSRKGIRIVWIAFAGFWVFLTLFFTMISLGWLGFMPSFEELEANKTITTIGGNTYRFLGWATAYGSDRVEWDSMETPWTLYHPINFLPSPQYIKNELAMFLYGNEIRLCVKTNLQEINVGNEKFKYSLNISGHNPEIRFFNNYPEEQGAYPWKSFDSQDFGRSFNCRVCDDSLICGSYEFRGWVRGDYDSTTPPSEFWTTSQETPTIDAIINPIIFTAVYLRSDNVYTITYYSGLD